MPIISEPKEIFNNIYLFDTEQFTIKRITSSFCYWDGEICILFDVGTSDNVPTLIRNIKNVKIPYEKIIGIVCTHYHFDHGGGSLRLWRKLVKKNPNFKIFTTEDMRDKLQNAEEHIIGAKTTFGEFVGTMDSLTDEEANQAYEIIQADTDFPIPLAMGYKLKILSTPGHTPDHCSPTIFKDEVPIFCFTGETAGCLYHSQKISPQPTSMPPNFHYKNTVDSVNKLKALKPKSIGFCHYGVITGEDDVQRYFDAYLTYLESLRNKIIELYNEDPSTRYIVENTNNFFSGDEIIDPYYNNIPQSRQFFKNLHLALIFGILVDLGYRESKYERKKEL